MNPETNVKDYKAADLVEGFRTDKNGDKPIFVAKSVDHQVFSYRSRLWEYFHFIHEIASDNVVKDWYMCIEPTCQRPFINCKLSSGNAKLKRHLSQQHPHIKISENEEKNEKNAQDMQESKNVDKNEEEHYKLNSSELCKALAAASLLGQHFGNITAETFQNYVVPINEPWSLSFVDKIEQLFTSNGIRNCIVKLSSGQKQNIDLSQTTNEFSMHVGKKRTQKNKTTDGPQTKKRNTRNEQTERECSGTNETIRESITESSVNVQKSNSAKNVSAQENKRVTRNRSRNP